MATPVGHMLLGATVSLPWRPREPLTRQLATAALAGAAPDLDFIPGLLLGDPSRFHHGPSHSLTFVLIAALVAALVVSWDRWRWALLVASAYGSHLLLDVLTTDPSLPVGLQLLWPLSDVYLASPWRPLPRVLHSSVSVINVHNFGVAFLELVLFGGLLLLSLWARNRYGSHRPPELRT